MKALRKVLDKFEQINGGKRTQKEWLSKKQVLLKAIRRQEAVEIHGYHIIKDHDIEEIKNVILYTTKF